ncbi:uncharacterized protein LOC123322465 [Coccinella septempunctata]|uniref:uncharacterized protein LOC123322462 n=1 Tax=Coccinella septempunctata TaxID=41139 RepID=UPI001D087580|nr:uncharacterized protein LOC123322462 [Coccinella septempunctata]XP_044766377.1 uncharacterized protein LOC123322465 [Coccinella septempunctata]
MKDGLPMGSPFSGPMSEIYLNFVEKLIMLLPLAQYIILWRRYVDDVFCVWAGTEEELRAFFNTLNIKFKIKFTIEKAQNNSLNFLDLKVTLTEHNTFTYNIFRKSTQTDVIIPYRSYHSTPIKNSAFMFLFHRLLSVPLSKNDFDRELMTIFKIAESNDFPRYYVENILSSIRKKILLKKIYPHICTKQNYISIPFFKEFNDRLNSILRKHDYLIVNKRHPTLENILTNNKSKLSNEYHSGIYKITCNDCPAFYIGMTTRAAKVRFNEHIKNRPKSAFGNHLIECKHGTTIENLSLIRKENNYNKLVLLEQHEILKNKDNIHLLNDISEFSGRHLFKYL